MDSVSSSVTLRNGSAFALTYCLEALEDAKPNFNNQLPFSFIPNEAQVPPGKDMKVKVVFSPDHARPWPFEQSLKVHVPNQLKEQRVHLRGRCHARQLFVVAADPSDDASAQQPATREDPLLPRPGLFSAASSTQSSSFGELRPDRPCIQLTFPRDRHRESRAIHIGCVAIADEKAFKGGAGAFELEWDPATANANAYFSASVDRGSVGVGAQVPVVFTFTPPAVGETYGLDVGQWARASVLVHLTGGFAHPHADLGPVRVRLRGFIKI